MKRGFKMSGKKKYSDEFKLKVVNEYLEGKNGGVKVLAAKYGLAHSHLRQWVILYGEGGVEYLTKVTRTYGGDFKVHVVEYMHQHSMSHVQAAAHFGIQSRSTVSKWERIYYEEGKEALYEERRGRSKNMSDKKQGRPPKKDVNENEDLLKEVQRLRMENEYLKKLIALVQERERSEQETE